MAGVGVEDGDGNLNSNLKYKKIRCFCRFAAVATLTINSYQNFIYANTLTIPPHVSVPNQPSCTRSKSFCHEYLSG